MKEKLDAIDALRLKQEEKEFIIDVGNKAKKLGISNKNTIYREGALKEAKRLLKEIQSND